MTKTKIMKRHVIVREPGYLYFIDKDGNVCRTKMMRGRKKK